MARRVDPIGLLQSIALPASPLCFTCFAGAVASVMDSGPLGPLRNFRCAGTVVPDECMYVFMGNQVAHGSRFFHYCGGCPSGSGDT